MTFLTIAILILADLKEMEPRLPIKDDYEKQSVDINLLVFCCDLCKVTQVGCPK